MLVRSTCLLGLSLGLVAQERPTLIHHVRIFDGAKVLDADTVLVKGGQISAVGKGLKAPEGAELIDGAGHTLLPGLIDAHTHVYDAALPQALLFGVTTELDMFTDATLAQDLKAHPKADQADLRSAGTLATAPGGHGTEYDIKIPTVSKPEDAEAFVAARFAEGSDYLKIVIDDGRPYGMSLPTLDAARVKALVAAAHARKRLAVAHIGSLEDAKMALTAGVDGLVHTFENTAPDAEVVALAKAKGAFIVPTLSVNATVAHLGPGKELWEDARIQPWLAGGQKGQLLSSFPVMKGSNVNYAHAVASMRAFKAAGVPILAGTDAPNPGTTHGASLHGELTRLVASGLTPLEALQAATAGPAHYFHLDDRGRIAPGLRADLLLVKGDPTTDITATRAITRIWKAGIAFDRSAALAALPKDPKSSDLAANAGSLGDFETSMKAPFGMGWAPTTDTMAGGKSQAKLELASEGAAGTKGSLVIQGSVAPGLPYAWAGAIWCPGDQAFSPVDVLARKALTFWAKGDGQTYRVLLYSSLGGYRPGEKSFVAGPEWKAFTFTFSDFVGVDPKALTAIAIVAGPQAGDFRLQMDEPVLK